MAPCRAPHACRLASASCKLTNSRPQHMPRSTVSRQSCHNSTRRPASQGASAAASHSAFGFLALVALDFAVNLLFGFGFAACLVFGTLGRGGLLPGVSRPSSVGWAGTFWRGLSSVLVAAVVAAATSTACCFSCKAKSCFCRSSCCSCKLSTICSATDWFWFAFGVGTVSRGGCAGCSGLVLLPAKHFIMSAGPPFDAGIWAWVAERPCIKVLAAPWTAAQVADATPEHTPSKAEVTTPAQRWVREFSRGGWRYWLCHDARSWWLECHCWWAGCHRRFCHPLP